MRERGGCGVLWVFFWFNIVDGVQSEEFSLGGGDSSGGILETCFKVDPEPFRLAEAEMRDGDVRNIPKVLVFEMV